ncbi:hypothetical protein LTR08_004270 [Meristemomyces frigidus]|nr:hypothetical protein LTR08_004270 [Meristemomyces frigidus]
MRPIARQSARLASHTRAASCSRIRQAPRSGNTVSSGSHHQTRTFSHSVQRASDVRPPGDHNAWLEQQREEQRKEEDGTSKSEQTPETENGEAKTTGDGRKPGMRRSMRNRRMTDVPKPPPVPDWFLRQNVALVKDETPESATDRNKRQIVRCVDTATGHTLFTVPYYEPMISVAVPEKRVLVSIDGADIDISVLGISSETWDALPMDGRIHWMVHALAAERARPPSEVDLEALGELLVALPRKEQQEVQRIEADNRRVRGSKVRKASKGEASDTVMSKSQAADLSNNFFDQQLPKRNVKPPSAEDKDWVAFQEIPNLRQRAYHPLEYVFLEAEASVLAAMSVGSEAQPSSSFASNRVDLSLHCPDSDSHDQMDHYIAQLADAVQADVIQLDTNDIEDLTADYVGQGQDSPGSFSTMGYDVFHGYEASSMQSMKPFGNSTEAADEFDVDEDEYDENEDDVDEQPSGSFGSMEDLRKALYNRRHELSKAFQGIGIAGITIDAPKMAHADSGGRRMSPPNISSSSSSEFVQWDDAKLGALLDGLLDAAKLKRAAPASKLESDLHAESRQLPTPANPRRVRRARTAQLLIGHMYNSMVGETTSYTLLHRAQGDLPNPAPPARVQRTIVHVRDLKDISRSRLGDAVLRRLVRVVQKRRRGGERIIIVGTTAQDSNNIFMSAPHESEDSPFRTITVPPLFKNKASEFVIDPVTMARFNSTLKLPAYNRILEINIRHVQSMLRRLQPGYKLDLLAPDAREQMVLRGTRILTEKVLGLDEVQRIVLIAIGLTQSHAREHSVLPIHIALATWITSRVDHTVQQWRSISAMAGMPKDANGKKAGKGGKEGTEGAESETGINKVEEVRGSCNPHESRLLTGVVDAKNIKVGFADVHAPADTIEALKTLTTLSLLRPEAFSYGVLANDRLPGLLLYGPPGTGKTLLAKAVAKESKATVLEVSGAQIYEKYVGEGEKMVRAVFSLAKKLSPCVVFIDEADAIFGSRSGSGNRNTHREIINQFLREWDGVEDNGVFIMVATNRPFDLDDAVLRRLPRRLLVDLPVVKDRESILGIHLKNEVLADGVSLAKLAEQTPLYSGSDLKNLCVAAALACVREENEMLVAQKEDKEFKLPEKRTLAPKHFERAISEISASISEDMGSLSAIKKFDEQYGDRRGRRKKAGYGFGIGGAAEGVVDESSVRVRQALPHITTTTTSGQVPPAP